jgi:hypothetical protein
MAIVSHSNLFRFLRIFCFYSENSNFSRLTVFGFNMNYNFLSPPFFFRPVYIVKEENA